MTKDAIEARLKVLHTDLQALQNNFYAVKGAIQDCEYWLSIVASKKETPLTSAEIQ